MIEAKTFATPRLAVAAYFLCCNHLPFVGCEVSEPGKVTFTFTDPDGLGEQLELKFDQNQGVMVDARSYSTAERFLKRQMYKVLGAKEQR